MESLKKEKSLVLMDLYNKPVGYKFTEGEKNIIKREIPKESYLVKYALWKQERKNQLYICIAIDKNPRRTRKAAIDNSLNVIATRDISDIEYEEEIENFGVNKRIINLWNYDVIETLIKEDLKYGVATPSHFISYCKNEGY
jgi:hypothetical protein